MAKIFSNQLQQMEANCGSLLHELQLIWDEVGESDTDRDKMLLEVEQECLDVYRRMVDLANCSRAQLRQAIADSEAELAAIFSAMGERPQHIKQSNQNAGSLKEEHKTIIPHVEEMRKKKSDRWNQFLKVLEQIRKISNEITSAENNSSKLVMDDSDLSTRRLEELQRELLSLQTEKSERLKQVLDQSSTLNSLCLVLGLDFKQTVSEVHHSLGEPKESKNISNETIERLGFAVKRLREVKIQRMQMLQDLATSMLELWNLMDTPLEEQQVFCNVTCNVAASEDEITEANSLSLNFIKYVEAEVSRLEEMKHSKMKELVLKKKTELKELRRRTHLVVEADMEIESAVEAGAVDPCSILEQIENQISSVKDEAFSRKDILERVDKWLSACNEDSWLEEYNRDDNRYAAARGAHLTLKRAEKARAMVRLRSMLEDYIIMRQEKGEERKRQRDQKKLQGQLIAEKEALFGSKPSPSNPQSAKKVPQTSLGSSSRRLSLGGGVIMQLPKSDLLHSAKPMRSAKKADDHAFLSPGSRGLDVAGLPIKKLSFNPAKVCEVDTPRKPFSPLPINNIPLTPTQPIFIQPEDENMTPKEAAVTTPKTPMTISKTPMTTSVPMQVTATPAPAVGIACDMAQARREKLAEYSFEESRFAYYLELLC